MAESQDAPVRDTHAVTELLRTTSRLIGVLEREIDMLRQMKPSEMQALQEEKIVLAAAYESRLKQIAADPSLVDSMTPELKAELTQTTERFQHALVENERVLRAAKHATDSLLDAIVDAVGKQQPEISYAANGEQRAYPTARSQSVAIDQRF